MTRQNKPFKVFQASAGSGKTYTIVKEYLELCLRDEASTANYRHILAITFTNMAANEMKAKIVHQLNDIIHADLSHDPEGMEADLMNDLGIDRTTLQRYASLLFSNIIHNYSDFCVCTIDAFVQKLARSFAKDLKLPNQFNVSIDEDEVADAITERIGERLGPQDPFLTKILENYSETKFDNESSPKIASNIHDFTKALFSEEAFQKNEQNHFATEEQYQETKDFLQKEVDSFEAECHQFTKIFEDIIQRHGLTDDDFYYKTKGPCLGFLNALKNKDYKTLRDRQLNVIDGSLHWYSKDFAKKLTDEIDKEFQSKVLAFMKAYQKRIGAYQFYESQLKQLSLYALRSIIKAEIDSYIGEAQVVHISEFNKRINEVMGDFSVPFIYERLGEHFKHLFIDEFQDTSILQWQNLLPLMDNSLANNQMSMIVGDGKQSIYRWRNGEVGQITSLPLIFNKPANSEAFDTFENSLIQHFNFNELHCNFRSHRSIVGFNNAFFSFCAPKYLSEDCRKVYQDTDERFGKAVTVEQQCKHEEEGLVQIELFDPKSSDDITMLQRIKILLEALQEKGFRKSDITILVRKNKIGSLIANYLNGEGIDVVSAESILLKSSDKVQLIIHTLDYLIHSDNKAVIANVLYYWHATHDPSFEGRIDGFFDQAVPIAEGKTTLEEVLGLEPKALEALLAHAYSLYDLCAALMRSFGFNHLDDAFLNFLLDVVYQWQSAEEAGIGQFLDYWERKCNKLSVIASQSDAINIMTVHKSKGLQFNVVIYPFVKDDIDDKRGSTLWIAPEQLGFGSIPNIEKVQFKITKETSPWTTQTRELAEQEDAKVRLDNMNLNYVAFTRPVQRLYVLSYLSDDDGKSPINAFLRSHTPIETEDTEPVVYQFGDPEAPKTEKDSTPQPIQSFFNDSQACEWTDRISIDPNPSMFWIDGKDEMKPQKWGDFVHQLLAEVSNANDIDRVLLPYCDSGVIDKDTANRLKALFQKMVATPPISEAFSDQAKVKNECEILSRDYGIIRPDRYAELPDKIYLLDYKTGKKSAEHHQQLSQYVSVLKKMVSKPIEAYLVYLGTTVEAVPVTIR